MILVTKIKMQKWNSYRSRAIKKNIEFTLNQYIFFTILHTQCYICGKDGIKNELGLDRINNNIGYVQGNVAACCWECNKAKGKLDNLKFLQWLKRLQPKHPLITKGHCQPKGFFNGNTVYIDVKINKDLLGKLNSQGEH